ncbi:MAG: dihydrodipicolinate synthase family protein, partial [Ignavibacteria bacterium]|nr:dihydrodipicolinate synthase family protein [Ignavibacteria bacterium]
MFKGVGTALITPFNNDLSVDLDSIKIIVRNQLENKIDALIVLGTTGESPVVNYDERRKIISAVVEEATGKVPVIIGTGSNDTK